MQEKGIGSVADRDAATDEAIMGLLVEDREPWAIGEVERMIGNQLAAADGLARMRRGGLVHQCGEFVFASRTALEAADIWGPYSTGEAESAMAAGKRGGKRPVKQRDPEEALLHVLAHPLRKRLLRLYVEEKGMLSPKELADFTKKHLSNVGYHVRVLAELGAVEIVAEQQRRGSVEHFYEATSLVDEVPWGRAALGITGEADQ